MNHVSSRISYWQFFRLVFVLFSFYLLFDALYRWGGFRFYSTFSEFLPGLALITILWSILSAIATFLLWFPLRTVELISFHNRWSKIDRLLLFLYIFSSLAAITLIGIREYASVVALPYQLKLAVFPGVVLIAVLMVVAIERISIHIKWEKIERLLLSFYTLVLLGVLIWFGNHLIWHNWPTPFQLLIIVSIIIASMALLYNDNAQRWIGIIQDKITIWVWVFSIWLLLSVPLLAYYTWFDKSSNQVVTERVVQSTETYNNRPNIILVTFDELTALDMSAYGYHRDTTPFISRWSKEASLFSRAKTSAPTTSSATTSLMTGKRVWNHRIFQQQAYIAHKAETENIPLLLKKNGYYNMAYISSEYVILEGSNISSFFDIYRQPVMFFKKDLNFCGRLYQGFYMLFGKNKIKLFDWIFKQDFIFMKFLRTVKISLLGGEFGYCNTDFYHDAGTQFSKILEDIDNDPPEPFFVWTHLWPTHQPYLPPKPYEGMFVSTLKLKEKDSPTENAILENRATYDEYIRYVDEIFKEFVGDRRLQNKMKNTVIILSSDHGMNPNPALDLTEIRLNIPLIIKEPDNRKGQVINDIVEQIDIPATILDLARIPKTDWVEGRSLLPLIDGKRLPPRPAFSMFFTSNPVISPITKGTIAIWESDFKLIHDLDKKTSQLFNLKNDPDELTNLTDQEPAIAEHLLNIIMDNIGKANQAFEKRQAVK